MGEVHDIMAKILEGTEQLLKRGRSVITHHRGPLLARLLVIMQNLCYFLLAHAAAAGISHKHQYQVLFKVLFPKIRQLQKLRGGQPCFRLSSVHFSAAIISWKLRFQTFNHAPVLLPCCCLLCLYFLCLFLLLLLKLLLLSLLLLMSVLSLLLLLLLLLLLVFVLLLLNLIILRLLYPIDILLLLCLLDLGVLSLHLCAIMCFATKQSNMCNLSYMTYLTR